MESLYGFRSIHGANCTVGLDIEMTRHREEVEEEKWWSCGGGGVAVRRLWFRRGGVAVDPPVALTLRSKLSLIKSLKDDTEVVPFTCTINGHEIQFGRVEFCLITGLRFGVEFSDDYLHGPLDFRRRVWESHVDGSNIIGEMLINKIHSEEFYSLRDEDVVAVCLLAVLHMVLLGQELKNNVPNLWLRHVDRHPRAVDWVNVETFYRAYLEAFFELMSFLIFKRAEPIGRLRADAFEAKAEWWVSSRAFFDGRICEPPQIPPAVRNDIYQRVAEQDRSIKELQQ
ncbi:phospholipase-like protein [Tanacetum coccineum]